MESTDEAIMVIMMTIEKLDSTCKSSNFVFFFCSKFGQAIVREKLIP